MTQYLIKKNKTTLACPRNTSLKTVHGMDLRPQRQSRREGQSPSRIQNALHLQRIFIWLHLTSIEPLSRETHHPVWAVCVAVVLLLIRPTFPYYRHKSMSQMKAHLFSLNYTKALNFSSPPLQSVTWVCLVFNGPVNVTGELTILHLLKSGPPNTGVICTTSYAVCHLHF